MAWINRNLRVPCWFSALACAAIAAGLCLYGGLELYKASVQRSMDRHVDRALDRALEELDGILDQAHSALDEIEPLAGHACTSSLITAMRRETDSRPALHGAFIVHDDASACGTVFGKHVNVFNSTVPRRMGLWLRESKTLGARTSSLIYSRSRAPYTINVSVYGDNLAQALRSAGNEVWLELQVGDRKLDRNGQLQPVANLPDTTAAHRPSTRHHYAVAAHLASPSDGALQRERLNVFGRLAMTSSLVGGLVFTWVYAGRSARAARAAPSQRSTPRA